MIVKYYGIFDSIQEEYVQTFTASNDEDAKRNADLAVRSEGFNAVKFKDRSLHHLFDFDSVSGQVVDNTVRQVFLFATAIENYKNEQLEKTVREKLVTDSFKQELKDYIIKSLEVEIHEESKQVA